MLLPSETMTGTMDSWATSPAARRLSAIELLVALVALFATLPFLERLRVGPLIESILLTIALISAVLAIAGRGVILIIASLIAAPTLAARWIHQYWPEVIPAEAFLISAIILLVFIIYRLLLFVLRAEIVDTEVLCASVSAYFLIGLLWTFAYWLIAEVIPGAFALNAATGANASMKGFNGVYFSFITLGTVGYGDITPVANVAKMLAAMEGMIGVLYVAVLIARLVSIRATNKPTLPGPDTQ